MFIMVFVAVFVVVVFSVARFFWWTLDCVADDLIDLFYKDEERWWWEKELPQAIGRSGFLTRAALKLLDEEGRLRQKVILIDAIRGYPNPKEGRSYYPGLMLLVRLNDNRGPRRRKEKQVRVKRPTLRQIPHYTVQFDSLSSS